MNKTVKQFIAYLMTALLLSTSIVPMGAVAISAPSDQAMNLETLLSDISPQNANNSLRVISIYGSSEGGTFVRNDGTLWTYEFRDDVSWFNVPRTQRVCDRNNWREVFPTPRWSTLPWARHLALNNRGELYSWGHSGRVGLLGLGDAEDRLHPERIGGNWLKAGSTLNRGVAINADGNLYNWGQVQAYGGGSEVLSFIPVPVANPGSPDLQSLSTISPGGHLAILEDGTLWVLSATAGNTIGGDSVRQLGQDYRWTSIHGNFLIREDGALWQFTTSLGLGSRILPVELEQSWVSVSSRRQPILAVNSEGELWGWDFSFATGFGFGQRRDVRNPVRLGADNNWSHISGDVAVRNNGTPYVFRLPIDEDRNLEAPISFDPNTSNQFPILPFIPITLGNESPPLGSIPVTPSPDAFPAVVFVTGAGNRQAGQFSHVRVNERDDVLRNLRNLAESNSFRTYSVAARPINNHTLLFNRDRYVYTMNSNANFTSNAKVLDRFLNRLERESSQPVTEVILVGYCTGGIIIRDYLNRQYNQQSRVRVQGVIQIAAPNGGKYSLIKPSPKKGLSLNVFGAARMLTSPPSAATRAVGPWTMRSFNQQQNSQAVPERIPFYGIGGNFFPTYATDWANADTSWLRRDTSNGAVALLQLGFADMLKILESRELFPEHNGSVCVASFRALPGLQNAEERFPVFPAVHSSTFQNLSWTNSATVFGKGNDVGEVYRIQNEFVRQLRTLSGGSCFIGFNFATLCTEVEVGALSVPVPVRAASADEAELFPLSRFAYSSEFSLTPQVVQEIDLYLEGSQTLIFATSIAEVDDCSYGTGEVKLFYDVDVMLIPVGGGTPVELFNEGDLWFAGDIEPGSYMIQLVSDEARDVGLSVLDLGKYGLRLVSDFEATVGSTFEVSATLYCADFESRATITSAEVSLDGGNPVSLIGTDVATGTLTAPNATGLSLLRAEVTGQTSQGVEFSRVSYNQITFALAAASLSGVYSLDSEYDAAGQIEAIDLSVGVQSAADALLFVEADIVDDSGNLVAHPFVEVEVSAGFNEAVVLNTDSNLIHQKMQEDGSFTVSEVRLIYAHDDFTQQIDYARDVAVSQSFSRNDFAATGATIDYLGTLYAGAVELTGTAFSTSGELTGVEVSFDGGEHWYDAVLASGSDVDGRTWLINVMLEEGTYGMQVRPVIDGVPVESPRLWASTVFDVIERPVTVTEHTVTFNSQGGSAVVARTVQDGQAIGELPTPTRNNHSFNGWWTTPVTGGSQITAGTLVTENMTIYARWTQNQQPPPVNHTITFNSQGGSAVANRTVPAGQPIGTLPTPTRANHTFNGWWTQATGGTQIAATFIPTGNMTLHARWTANQPPQPQNHTITFNSQGGSAVAARTVQAGQAIGTLPTPTRANHTFNGWWTTASGAGTQITATFIPTGNMTLHARWTASPVNHTITFNSQGGSAVAARTVQAGQAIGTLPTPTRTNYTFNGWWTASTGGTQVTATTVVTGNMTLHARWISNAPTRITINAPASNIILRNRTLNLGNRLNFTFATGATQNRTVTWTSSNTNVATVNANGVVTGRNPGTSTIRVRSTLNQNATATFAVRVEAAPTAINTATQNITTIRMRQGRTLSLPIVVRGSTASALNNTQVTINWRANNRNVATLTNAGSATINGNRATGSFRPRLNATRNLTIRAVGTGTTSIVLTSQNGRQRTIRVRVMSSATSVTNVRIGNLPSNNTMNRNRTRTLRPRINPTNATLQGNIRWTSSNRQVATIDGAGRVTTHRSGTTNITLRVGTQTHRVMLRVR